MKSPFVEGNRLTLLDSGAEFFPALIAAIDGATTSVRLETYIFADDPTGRLVAAALLGAARRGVRVSLMVDGFGGREFQATLMDGLVRGGVHVLIYRPERSLFRFTRRSFRRLHRKMCVVDGRVAFVGGINIQDDLNSDGSLPPRFDFAVRVEGPLVAVAEREMAALWGQVVWARSLPLPSFSPTDTTPAEAGDASAALVVRDNVRHRRDIERAYLDAVRGAKHEVILANAYFLPGPRFRRALISAAARGVEVTVIVQGLPEYRLQHYATQYLYGSLLSAGISVVEYERSFLHAKVAVIDGAWATVGSSNIDPFSLLMAREANVITRDPAFAGALRSRLLAAAGAESKRLRREEWESASIRVRLLRWGSYRIVRLLLSLARNTHAPRPRRPPA